MTLEWNDFTDQTWPKLKAFFGNAHDTWPYLWRSHCQQRWCRQRAFFAAPLLAISLLDAPLLAKRVVRDTIFCDTIVSNAHSLCHYHTWPYYPRRPLSETPIVDNPIVKSWLPTPINPDATLLIPLSVAPLLVTSIDRGHIVCGQIIRDADYSRRPSSTQRII